jgi:hypothetical protein
MWARGEKLPSQIPSSMMRCHCGERFDSHDPTGSHVHRWRAKAGRSRRRVSKQRDARFPTVKKWASVRVAQPRPFF